MDVLDKLRIKTYVRAKHLLSLAATLARVRSGETTIANTDIEIEEHKLALAGLKEFKAEMTAELAGYKKAAAEKQ